MSGKKAAVAHIAVQLDGENMMSFKVKCQENPLMTEMNQGWKLDIY